MARATGRSRKPGAAPSHPQKELPPPRGPHASFASCLAEFHVALGRLGMGEDALAPYQQRVLHELIEGLSEASIARLYDWWDYDLDALVHRDRHEPMKPRVALRAQRTRAGNLSVEWEPDGGRNTDWVRWHRGGAYAGYRPTNELLFVREFCMLDPVPRDYTTPFRRSVDEHLLALGAALIRSLQERLRHSFRVRFITELELKWKPRPEGDWLLSGQHVLGWSIVNVEERAYWAERAELEAELAKLGHDAKGFVRLLLEAHPGLTLATLQDIKVRQKLRFALASRGVTLTPAPLAQLIEMLERHQPLALAPLRRPLTV